MTPGVPKPLAEDELPPVSVVMPIRNEGDFIERSLGAILAQDYPPGKLEVVVVDGMSDDDTRDRVAALAGGTIPVRLLDNPSRFVPAAMNIGIRASSGSVIVRVDGHTIIAQDYVRCAAQALHRTRAHNVGGLMCPVPEGHVRRSVTAATSSRFGVGAAVFHYSETEREADTVYLGTYPKWVLEHIGMYDEEFVRNQDDELNDRLRKAGGRVMLCPEIRSDYYPRTTLTKLAKQYFQYGWWKVRCYQKHPRDVSLAHLVPGAFALALVGGAVLMPFIGIVRLLWVAMLSVYAAGAVAFSVAAGRTHGWTIVPTTGLVFPIVHLSYGFGFLLGAFRFAAGWMSVDAGIQPLPSTDSPLWAPHGCDERPEGIHGD